MSIISYASLDVSLIVRNYPALLANNLPKASIFFLTLILASNLSGAAKTYSRAVPFVMYLLRPILGGKTPRKFWISEHKMVSHLAVHVLRYNADALWL